MHSHSSLEETLPSIHMNVKQPENRHEVVYTAMKKAANEQALRKRPPRMKKESPPPKPLGPATSLSLLPKVNNLPNCKEALTVGINRQPV